MAHDGSFQHFTWLYLTVSGSNWLCPALPSCARLYLAVPSSAMVSHDLPFHRLPHTANDWPKCFCIYRLKCSKAIRGWDGRMKIPAVLIICQFCLHVQAKWIRAKNNCQNCKCESCFNTLIYLDLYFIYTWELRAQCREFAKKAVNERIENCQYLIFGTKPIAVIVLEREI